MRRLGLFGLLLVSACSPTRLTYQEACSLVSDPERYEGRRVEILGTIWAAPDGSPQFESGCRSSRRLAVRFREGLRWSPPVQAAPPLIVTATATRNHGDGPPTWFLDVSDYRWDIADGPL